MNYYIVGVYSSMNDCIAARWHLGWLGLLPSGHVSRGGFETPSHAQHAIFLGYPLAAYMMQPRHDMWLHKSSTHAAEVDGHPW